jgi:hypothetical protein
METTQDNDQWNLIWGGQQYSTKKYTYISWVSMTLQKPYWIFGKHVISLGKKLFAWLLLYNRLNTKKLMTRKNFYVAYKDCILCDTCDTCEMKHFSIYSLNAHSVKAFSGQLVRTRTLNMTSQVWSLKLKRDTSWSSSWKSRLQDVEAYGTKEMELSLMRKFHPCSNA